MDFLVVFFSTVLVFLSILELLIFADVILSWLTLLGLNLRPAFFRDLLDPLYFIIKKNIPTSLGPIDFTPVLILIFIFFIRGIIVANFPEAGGALMILNNL